MIATSTMYLNLRISQWLSHLTQVNDWNNIIKLDFFFVSWSRKVLILVYLSRRGVYAIGGSDIYTLEITIDSNLSLMDLIGYNTEGICL